MKRTMYISFIIIGCLVAIVGIAGIARQEHNTETVTNPKEYATEKKESATLSDNSRIGDNDTAINRENNNGDTISAGNRERKNNTTSSANEQKGNTINVLSDSERKGFLFEQFVDAHFDNKYFNRLEWRQDIKGLDGRLSESSKYPDLEYEIRKNKQRFAVECKWRGKVYNDSVRFLSSEQQLERYRAYSKEHQIDVIVLLGVGGSPNNPQQLYSIPLANIQGVGMSTKQLEHYRFETIPTSFFYMQKYHNLSLH